MSEETAQLKLLTIGDSGVGKTWLLLRWAGVTGKLSIYGSSMPTIGIDFKMKTSVINGRRVKIQVWDTAGQERFRNITTSYYRHSQGIIMVYDITDSSTFDSIRSWMHQIETHAESGVSTILVGNKCDLEENRAVSFAQGEALAKEFGIPFLETSAVESLNVDEAFNKLTQIVYDRLESTGMLSRRPSGSFKNSPTPANGGGSNYRQGSNVSSVDLNQQGGRGCCTG